MSFQQHTPIYFIGDVHSRPELVRAALEMADGNPVVFLGDIFDGPGGPDGSAECLRLIMNSPNAELILGNHEAYPVFSGYWDEGSNLARFWGLSPHSQEAIRIYHEWLEIKHRLYLRELEWLMSRPVYIQGDGWIAAHAKVPDGPLPPEIWSDYPYEQQAQIEMLDNTAPLYPGHFWAQDYDGRHGFAIVGHTRLPKVGEFAWDHCILLDWDAKNVGTAAYAIWFDGSIVEVGGLDPLGRTSNPGKPKTPEQKAAKAEYDRQRRLSLTPEERADYLEGKRQKRLRRLAAMPAEEREALREHERNRRASMTPEERKADNEIKYRSWRRKLDAMTPEERADHKESERQRRRRFVAAMTPEKRAAYNEKQRQYHIEKYRAMTPEERAVLNENRRIRYLSMPPKERADLNEKRRIRYAAIRERLERARLGVLAYFTKKEIEEMREEERARRESMTEEERAAERDAFRDRLNSIGFGAPDFTGLERLRADELRAMAAFIASQRGTHYEEIMEDEEEEEESALEEGLDSEDFDDDLDDGDSREPNPTKPLTPEQRAKYAENARLRRAAMTPEEKAAVSALYKERYQSMTPEQRERRRESLRRHRASMTPEQRAARSRSELERYHSMTPEQKAARKERMRQQRASMTPEERAAYNEHARERRARIRERLERARLGVLAYFTKKEIEEMRDEELARRESMTEEELSAERDAFRDRLNSIGFGAPDFAGLERLREDELRAMAAFIASQRGTRYEEIMEDEAAEEAEILDADDLEDDSREPNPRVSAKRTDEALWKRIVKRITAGSKGGYPGQWSARKAQLAVAEYKAKGGEYIGKKSKDNSLHKWTVQDWRTKSGRASLETGERYLPAKAIEALSDEEYRETSRAKRAGLHRGQQFTPQPEHIAHKVARYRKNNPAVWDAEDER